MLRVWRPITWLKEIPHLMFISESLSQCWVDEKDLDENDELCLWNS